MKVRSTIPLVWTGPGPPPARFTCSRFPMIRLQWVPTWHALAVIIDHPRQGWRTVDLVPIRGRDLETVARGYFHDLAAA